MSTRARGRGAFDRGGRGAFTPRGRGSTPRGSFDGSRPTEGNAGPPSNTFTPRGPRGSHGGTFRGSNTTGRGSYRGRGGHIKPPMKTSSADVLNSTPCAQDDYAARLEYLRKERPRLKQRLIAEGKENPEGQIDITKAVDRYGLCEELCPEMERVRRILEKDLKLPEYTPESLQSGDRNDRVPDESRMVKAYARPAAGNEADLASDIRSPATCLRTMEHMADRLDHDDFDFLHGWLWDRTRAVRKDLSSQKIKDQDLPFHLGSFEMNARMLILSLHHMARGTKEDYSHQQDMEQLGAALLSLKYRYADNRKANLEHCNTNEAEMAAYRLILFARDTEQHVESEVKNSSHLHKHPLVQTALDILRACRAILDRNRISFSTAKQNWQYFWELLSSSRVTYLMACAAEVNFSKIRHTILNAIYKVYRQKQACQELESSWLQSVLGFDTTEETEEFCELYSFSFATTGDGIRYLDMSSGAFQYKDDMKKLDQPYELTDQAFSQRIVEAKRGERALSDFVKGLDGSGDDDGDSLFIKDSSEASTANGSSPAFSAWPQAQTIPSMNPFAKAFQPNGAATNQSSTKTPFDSPFASSGAASTLTGTASPFKSPFITNGVSTATSKSNNPFKPLTASNPTSNAASAVSTFGKPSGLSGEGFGSFKSTSPFVTSPTTGQKITPGLFDSNTDSIKFAAGPAFTTASATAASTTATAQPTTSTGSDFLFTGASAAAKPASLSAPNFFKPLGTPASTDAGGPSLTQSSASFVKQTNPMLSSATSETHKPFSFMTGATASPASSGITDTAVADQAERDRKAEAEKRRKEEEEEGRRKEEQELRAREEEQARARQREIDARVAQERQAQAERARIAREEQERREQEAREEQERREAIRQRRESSLQNLTSAVFSEPREGLLMQFIEQQVRLIAYDTATIIEHERDERIVRELCERKRMQRVRRCCLHWYNMVLKKKNRKRARDRRKWLKETIAMEERQVGNLVAAAETPAQRNSFKKPEAPASAGLQRVDTLRPSAKAQSKQAVHAVNGSTSRAVPPPQRSSSLLGEATPTKITSFRRSTAPKDRTETDYFRLRAKGIDPSQLRKRGHDSDVDPEGAPVIDRKRARTSISSLSQMVARPEPASEPSVEEDELIARYNNLKKTITKTKTHTRSQSVRSNRDISAVLANARALMSKETPFKNSMQDTRHEFSRSVPDITSQPHVRQVSLGQSTTSPAPAGKPAYYGRVSRFVPRALYGKGGDVVRDYMRESRGHSSGASSVANEGPLNISSPIPTPQSSVAETQFEVDVEADGDVEDSDEIFIDHDDSDEEVEEDVDELEEEDVDEEIDPNLMDGDDFESEYSEDEIEEDDGYAYGYGSQQQDAQVVTGPGATQDDAIELSD